MSSLLFVGTCVLQIVERYTRKTLTMSLFNLAVFFLYFFKLGFLHARLNSHYEAGITKKKKRSKKDLSIQEISLEITYI